MNTASRTSTSSSAKELQEAGARSDTNSDSLTDISFFVSLVEFLNFNINKFALLWGEAQLCLPYVCL